MLDPVLLDSGAFSAWSTGKEIAVSDYCHFLDDHAHRFDGCFNLDVMPKVMGSTPHIQHAADRSYDNWVQLGGWGHNTIPVYHLTEPLFYLNRMATETDLVAIGGMKGVNDLTQKLDQVWAALRVVGYKGRVHALGLHDPHLLFAHPWDSSDTSFWKFPGNKGWIIVPKPKGMRGYDYSRKPADFGISPREGYSTQVKHLDLYGPAYLRYVEKYCTRQGLILARVRRDRDYRHRFNLRFYRGIEAQGGPAMFYVDMVGTDSAVLTREGIKRRLVSFWYLRNKTPKEIDHYFARGVMPRRRSRL